VPLSDLTAGRYDVQVSVLEPNGQKVNFWWAPLVLLP
jgi:hypothetical protein